MDLKRIREEDLAVLNDIVHDENARATDRIQAIKIRESIITECTAADGKQAPTEADILRKIRGQER